MYFLLTSFCSRIYCIWKMSIYNIRNPHFSIFLCYLGADTLHNILIFSYFSIYKTSFLHIWIFGQTFIQQVETGARYLERLYRLIKSIWNYWNINYIRIDTLLCCVTLRTTLLVNLLISTCYVSVSFHSKMAMFGQRFTL